MRCPTRPRLSLIGLCLLIVPAFAALSMSTPPPYASVPESTKDSACPRPGPVLVTGGSRGIGRATSLLLARRGYDVAINYANDAEAARSVVKSLNAQRRSTSASMGRVAAFRADVSSEDEVIRLYDEIRESFGADPSALVNNAGILGTVDPDVRNVETSDLDKVFRVNVYGPFLCAREFVRRSGRASGGQGGAIVNVSSGSAKIGSPLVYAMSKGAMDSMMAGLAKTLPPSEGIRINAVSPGMTETDMVTREQIESKLSLIPMGRAAKAEEIAETIAFLVSDASSYCSGANIRVAGGRP